MDRTGAEQDGSGGAHLPYNILSVIGTRPEAIKMRPVLRALSMLPIVQQKVVLTGQHRGLVPLLEPFAPSELYLDLTEHSPGEMCEAIRDALAFHLLRQPQDLVIVQGDTASALAGALAAQDCGIAVAHVEAGLRSHREEPWPEEPYRVAIDSIADLLFAPTEAAAYNLALEPAVCGEVHVTGNSGVDALLEAIGPACPSRMSGRKRILVTAHRRENRRAQMLDICAALKRLVRELPVEVLFLLHSNGQHRGLIAAELGHVDHVELRDAVGHDEMVELMLASWLVLTDSGGVQEDGPPLGRPVLVMRKVTERVEAPDHIRLVGTEPGTIVAAVNEFLLSETAYGRAAKPTLPFGDGQAAVRIAAVIADWLSSRAGRSRILANPELGLDDPDGDREA